MDATGTSAANRLHPAEIDRIAAALAGPHCVVAAWQLRRHGVGKGAVAQRCASGRWRPLGHGIYQLGSGRLTRRGRWLRDVLSAGEGAVLADDCAAMLWNVRSTTNRRTTVVTDRRGRRKRRDIDLRTTRHLPPEDVTTIDGIAVTSLARTLADCARSYDDEQLEAALERAVIEHRLELSALPQSPKRLRRLVADCGEGAAMTRSELENRFRRLLKAGDLPQPLVNRDVWTGTRFYTPDFLWPEHGLIVEIDGWATHRARTEADRRREAHLSTLGFTIQRYTRLQLIRRPHEITAALRPFLVRPHSLAPR